MKIALLTLMIGLMAGLPTMAQDQASRLRSLAIATEESDMCLAASLWAKEPVIAAEAWYSGTQRLEGQCVVRFLGDKGGAGCRMKKDKAKGWQVVESVPFNRRQVAVRMGNLIALRSLSHFSTSN